jgi:hypothetical protein
MYTRRTFKTTKENIMIKILTEKTHTAKLAFMPFDADLKAAGVSFFDLLNIRSLDHIEEFQSDDKTMHVNGLTFPVDWFIIRPMQSHDSHSISVNNISIADLSNHSSSMSDINRIFEKGASNVEFYVAFSSHYKWGADVYKAIWFGDIALPYEWFTVTPR